MNITELINNPLFENAEIARKVNELLEMQAYIESQKDALHFLFTGKIPECNVGLLDGLIEEPLIDDIRVKMCWSIIRKPFVASGKETVKEGWRTVLDF